jgi:hypothetical protein
MRTDPVPASVEVAVVGAGQAGRDRLTPSRSKAGSL